MFNAAPDVVSVLVVMVLLDMLFVVAIDVVDTLLVAVRSTRFVMFFVVHVDMFLNVIPVLLKVRIGDPSPRVELSVVLLTTKLFQSKYMQNLQGRYSH